MVDSAPEIATTLALAVVGSSAAPLVLLDRDCRVLGASASFLAAFDLPPTGTIGTSFFDLGSGEWNRPRIRSLLGAALSGAGVDADYEVDLDIPGEGRRRLVLGARLLDHVGGDRGHLLLSVADVTLARIAVRLKDEMIAEKAVLLQELRHRVANSLQIISGVLMQGARKLTPASAARLHLQDAHNRVMSVAMLQRQLAVTAGGTVDLGAYLLQLCASLGASMIEDHDLVSLTSTTAPAMVEGKFSVSFGLVVTELVINALKHAFQPGDHGKVVVDYAVSGSDWVLAVSDDGVGMPAHDAAVPGLGSSLVGALAKHLEAEINVTDNHPGTRVELVHNGASTAAAEDETAV